MKRSATTGFGQWETVREEPVVYDDLGLPNQPAYEGEETDEHITEQVRFLIYSYQQAPFFQFLRVAFSI